VLEAVRKARGKRLKRLRGRPRRILRILDWLEEILIASPIAAATVVIFVAVVHRYAVGLNLFIASGIAKLGMMDPSIAVPPWLATLLVFLGFVTYIPKMSLWLPRLLGML
jgi:TRAP-type C4-dicarboxylate transport system permease large subunit